jgi:hypothetical protein
MNHAIDIAVNCTNNLGIPDWGDRNGEDTVVLPSKFTPLKTEI